MSGKYDAGLLLGTLDLLILRTLSWGPARGCVIARWIKTTSDDAISVEDRALHLALHRLEDRGGSKATAACQKTIAGRSTTNSPRPGALSSA